MISALASKRAIVVGAALVVAMAGGACASGAQSKAIQLAPQNDSGVAGSVTLTEVGPGQTRVDISVEPGNHLDMPAHVHPGSCANPVPQPRYPLTNVVNGSSSTVIPASFGELFTAELFVNLHLSNEDLRTSTACADID